MSELKQRGCKFSLDDFGTGVSSFVYLKSLPVDFLKIDGQFISHVAQDPVNRSMVEAIGKVGRALGIATVAECVETQAVLEELKRIGVDYAQGFYLARPAPIAQLRVAGRSGCPRAAFAPGARRQSDARLPISRGCRRPMRRMRAAQIDRGSPCATNSRSVPSRAALAPPCCRCPRRRAPSPPRQPARGGRRAAARRGDSRATTSPRTG